MLVVDGIAASASRNMGIGGYGSRIAFAEPVIGRAFARPVGSLVRDDVNFGSEFVDSVGQTANSKYDSAISRRDFARGLQKLSRLS
jgi:hypothetical protein